MTNINTKGQKYYH